MSIWNWLGGWFSGSESSSVTGLGAESSSSQVGCEINPATGLPMVGGCGGVDVYGNPYGTDSNEHDISSSTSTIDDTWSTTSSFDDTWNTTSSFDDTWNTTSSFDDSWSNTSSFDD
jgi:hypothetical protein